MKKVEKVSIAEIAFTLDSDAYAALRQYLDTLEAHYAKDPDGREIMRDIEGRIAELILDRQVYTKVVPRVLIDSIVAQLGRPEEIDSEAVTVAAESSEQPFPRRLHRSREGRMVGGVCSGMARFLDTNVVWIRLFFLLPMILFILAAPLDWYRIEDFGLGWSWVFIVIYVVLWIALPMARTPRQRLEARGERITAESIRQNLQGSASTPSGRKAASVAAELLTVVGRILLFCVKFVFAIAGFSLLITVLAFFLGLMAVIFTPAKVLILNDVGMLSVLNGMSVVSPVVFLCVSIVCVMLPLLTMAVAMLGFVFGWRIRRAFYAIVLGIWGVAVVLLTVVSMSNMSFFHNDVRERIEIMKRNGNWDHHGHRDGRNVPGQVDIRPIPVDSLETWQADSIAN